MSQVSIRSQLLVVGLLVSAAALSGCTAASGEGGSPALTTIKQGTLTVGTSLPTPPMEFFAADGSTPTGVDIDLMKEAAKRLGLTIDIQNTAWDGLIPAAKSNRYDVVWASIGDFTDRQKQLDFVDYLSVRSAVLVKKSEASGFTSQESLCGKTVGGSKGTIAIRIAQDFSANCASSGLAPITVSEFPDDPTAQLALRSGQINAEILDGPTAVYLAETVDAGNTYAVALPSVGPEAIYGVGLNKANTGLRDALAATLNKMIGDGTYDRILKEYGVESYAIKEATVNGGGGQGS